MLSRLARQLGYYAPDQAPKLAAEPGTVLRIGVMGAATIAPFALIYPTYFVENAVVVAVAARDKKRAESFAKKHNIKMVFDSYEAMVASPLVDAVYIPTPNGLHLKHALMCLRAGKHVLCEKPITSNADEARILANEAVLQKRVVMEAAHSFHHPCNLRVREIVRSGELGRITHFEARFMVPFIPSNDIRYNINGTNSQLAGGALMDTGSYVCNARFVADLSFVSVTSAKAVERFPGVDETMKANVMYKDPEGNDVTGVIETSMALGFPWLPSIHIKVQGTKGSIYLRNFVAPNVKSSITVTLENGKSRTEHVYGTGATSYEYCIRDFVKACKEQPEGGVAKFDGTIENFANSMEMTDAIYLAAGLGKRVGYGA